MGPMGGSAYPLIAGRLPMIKTSNMSSTEMPVSQLYERDYYTWIENQVRALRERRLTEIDWSNVAEELEDLGRSQKRSIESQLARIAEHFLKLAYAPIRVKDQDRRGWELTIREARHQIRKLLNESPSLRRKTAELLVDAYESGRNAGLITLKLPDFRLPESCSWGLEQILDDRFFPAAERVHAKRANDV